MEWTNSYHETMLCFTNNIPQRDGGTHLAGFRAALTRTINTYANESGIAKKEKLQLTGEDMREGLTSILSVKAARPQILVPDQGQAGLVRGPAGGRGHRRRPAAAMARGASRRRQAHRCQGGRGGGRARGGAQGARTHPPQGRARYRQPAGQARRLPGTRSREERAVHRRGRQRRRLGEARARPALPGDPAAQGQDPQCRARALRQDAGLGRDRHAHRRDRHRHRPRGVRRRRRRAITASSS